MLFKNTKRVYFFIFLNVIFIHYFSCKSEPHKKDSTENVEKIQNLDSDLIHFSSVSKTNPLNKIKVLDNDIVVEGRFNHHIGLTAFNKEKFMDGKGLSVYLAKNQPTNISFDIVDLPIKPNQYKFEVFLDTLNSKNIPLNIAAFGHKNENEWEVSTSYFFPELSNDWNEHIFIIVFTDKNNNVVKRYNRVFFRINDKDLVVEFAKIIKNDNAEKTEEISLTCKELRGTGRRSISLYENTKIRIKALLCASGQNVVENLTINLIQPFMEKIAIPIESLIIDDWSKDWKVTTGLFSPEINAIGIESEFEIVYFVNGIETRHHYKSTINENWKSE